MLTGINYDFYDGLCVYLRFLALATIVVELIGKERRCVV